VSIEEGNSSLTLLNAVVSMLVRGYVLYVGKKRLLWCDVELTVLRAAGLVT
jgi:hypothetical protein